MPLNKDIKKVMVIGSGPIIIGQAAEFDYAGTQACRALKEDGIEVVLVNSNPATIMTDNHMADRIYIEPLTLPVLERIIEKEKPDSLLSTLGGQTGLTLSMQLAKDGFLDKMGVRLLGANPETIDKAEDRQLFKDTMQSIGQPVIPSRVVTTLEDAKAFAAEIGFPLIIRPAFTLGGTGGGIVANMEELCEICSNGLRLSPIGQVLVEQSVAGWKEIEFEVMRDARGNVITVCSMENLDPVGVHTGDSIVIAPAVTLSDKEYQMLRTAALDIIGALKVEGGCNVQFALNPDSFEYMVIEVNPRVSRSSALASKATGYPIAKVATKIAIGYTLSEIKNAVTGKTSACFEPALDYVVVKFPKWPFDKFVYAKRTLGTQMKATGEVMAIGTTFEEAIMKAVRGAEIGHDSLIDKTCRSQDTETLRRRLHDTTDERIFVVYEALTRGVTVDEIFESTKIDRWFLNKLLNLVNMDAALAQGAARDESLDEALYIGAKRMGYPDRLIESLSGLKITNRRRAVFKMVDTCAAEFSAETPYFYSTYDSENEAAEFIKAKSSSKKTVIVFGSGPIRIGQGIEFDYASVHCVWALKAAGYEVVIVNNNPETVSTDFDTADRLYFEPLTPEDVWNIIETEKPFGAVVAFGGQTAIKLTAFLDKMGVNILGTAADSIDAAEDRERFDALLENLNIARPVGGTVMTETEALEVAQKIGYPVLMRPSYVLGGQNMIIAFSEEDIHEYMAIILAQNIENPVLIDKYLMGTELEVDAICDGEEILIPGIMEHVERAGIHSGDSIAVYPAWNIDDDMREIIVDSTAKLALALKTMGLVNIQYLINQGKLYVIEVNPRSSRTIPYISKVTGVPMVDLATRCMLGEKLRDMGYGTGLYKKSPYVAVKVPVFSFEKLLNVDTLLGPEMKSTGEVLGIATTREEALYKGLRAAGYKLHKSGGIFVTVRDRDKAEIIHVVRKFSDLGFTVYATAGTADAFRNVGIEAITVGKIHESENNGLSLIESGKVDYVISTSTRGRIPTRDGVKIRRKAVERSIPCLTSVDTASAVVDCLMSKYSQSTIELVDINHMRREKLSLPFSKMQTCGNDYIYFNCLERPLESPESLSIRLSDRHLGIGGDGVVLICPSDIADASVQIYNMDGTNGGIGGNALRCVCKYLYDAGIVQRKDITIEANGKVRKMRVFTTGGKVSTVTADMGRAEFAPSLVPVNLPGENVVNRPVTIAGGAYSITCLSVGNPHCVVFLPNIHSLEVQKIGPLFEHDPLFPERVNTEFVQYMNETTLSMRVWERGNGETQASGTGACAAAVAAVVNGFCKKDTDITVKLAGGDLKIRYTDDGVFMTGSATKCFDGIVEI
ncbi:carbamoyl-phosphate synthase large subunit [Sporobacter termitidis DSM 10068]|uniref:Multifunctional fusion protein n=1 Tax=Sporobacter termitidis DSM 10068 TaxID=1123282 RepID=A0A1M5Y2E9_9FIRM|nr:carbamoyl-phosphate synthase large subunit [Sporobacter termitidis]SHI06146.1 carbamoyl-phosphate synthase large subunit [Sporobacter termitidis DSM 10068]